MAYVHCVGSQQHTAPASLSCSFPNAIPLCPALPSPGWWHQGASLEAGRPRDLERGNCSHLSDRRGLSCVLGGGSRQESGLTGRDLGLAL